MGNRARRRCNSACRDGVRVLDVTVVGSLVDAKMAGMRNRDALEVARLSLGGGLGLIPLGVAFGMMVIQAGFPWWVAPVLSIVVYAGSVELLLVSLIAASTPVLTVGLTVLLVNVRHVFYAFSYPIDRVYGLARAYGVYALTDETYAFIAGGEEHWTGGRIIWLQVLLQAYWVGGGLIGVATALSLPRPIEGLEFALVALFIVLALDAARTRREVPSVVMATGCFGVALLVAPGAALLTSMVLFTAALFGRHLMRERSRHA